MSKKHQIIVFLTSFLLVASISLWAQYYKDNYKANNAEKTPKANAVYLQQVALIDGLCETDSEEGINRLHLQQSWFHDAGFQEIAGAFGNVAFTLYKKGADLAANKAEEKVEAAFCIEGDVLNAQFYETKQKLKSFDINSSGVSLQYQSRLKAKQKEFIRVVSLGEKQMILYFENQKRQQRYFRKN